MVGRGCKTRRDNGISAPVQGNRSVCLHREILKDEKAMAYRTLATDGLNAVS